MHSGRANNRIVKPVSRASAVNKCAYNPAILDDKKIMNAVTDNFEGCFFTK